MKILPVIFAHLRFIIFYIILSIVTVHLDFELENTLTAIGSYLWILLLIIGSAILGIYFKTGKLVAFVIYVIILKIIFTALSLPIFFTLSPFMALLYVIGVAIVVSEIEKFSSFSLVDWFLELRQKNKGEYKIKKENEEMFEKEIDELSKVIYEVLKHKNLLGSYTEEKIKNEITNALYERLDGENRLDDNSNESLITGEN